jgi:glucosyl-3-phosphoglycerate synthase
MDDDPDQNQINKNFTIILPALNEEKTIEKTVKEALATGAGEVLVIDDGSTDSTVSLLAPLLQHPELKIISHPRNLGCGAARKTGIMAATNSILVFFDCDIENINREMMSKLVGPVLKNEADFVMASFENFGRVTEFLVKPLLAYLVPDLANIRQPLSGMFAVHSSYLNPERINSGHAISRILLDVYFAGARITEVDIGAIIHRKRLDVAKREQAISECQCILNTLSERGLLNIRSPKTR